MKKIKMRLLRLHLAMAVVFSYFLTFSLSHFLFADVSSARFLEVQPSVKVAAMGDASSSIYGESSLMLSNPANTSFANQSNVSVSYNKYIQDISQGLVSGLFLFPGGTAGLGYSSLKMKDEPIYDEFGRESGTKFSYGGSVISGNISTFLTKDFAVGANVKSVKEEIGSYSATTFCFDLGLGAKVDFLHFGLSYLNIGKIDDYKLPTSLRVGASATIKPAPMKIGELTVCSDYVVQIIENKSEIGVGAEYIISEVIAPRIGYKVSLSKGISGITGGFRLKLKKDSSLDYAFVPYQDFGDTHNVELSVAFRTGKEEEEEQAKPIAKPLITKPLIEKTTVAIMNLAAAEGMSASDVAMISELLRTAIINTNTFIVIERGQIEQVMSEAGFQQTGCTDQSCAVKIGNMVNAKKVIVGSVGKLGTDYIINIRLVDVETSKVEYADKGKTAVLGEMEVVVDELAKRLASSVK